MQFITTKLAGSRLLVTDGNTGGHSCVLSTKEWDEVKAALKVSDAQQDFDAAVEKFFAPIVEAAEKLTAIEEEPEDPAFHVVLQEGVDPTEVKDTIIADLSYEAAVVRILESGDHSRLIWVGDTIEITEFVQVSDEPATTEFVPF